MSSGIKWREEYENNPTQSDVALACYRDGREDIIKYIFNRSHGRSSRGKFFSIQREIPICWPHILNKTLDLAQFAHDKLWSPLGITNYTMEKDPAGNFYGGSHFYLSPRGWPSLDCCKCIEESGRGDKFTPPIGTSIRQR